jgi:hypothetical protein
MRQVPEAKQITLGKKVMVSDPTYSVPTWCQIKLDNVKPGNYYVFCKKVDTGGWGVRNSMLTAIHEDHIEDTKLNWKKHFGEVGVDSGQAGIFSMETYRVDGLEMVVPDKTYDGSEFFLPGDNLPGDDWYLKMCKITLSERGWGSYSNGVVCRSGFGDGGYDLWTAKKGRSIVALAVDFDVEVRTYIDLDWYRHQTVV